MFRVILLFALAVVATGQAQAGPAPFAVITLDPYLSQQSAVHATIGGHPGTFLFDTGEGVSMISPALAAAVGCAPWGNIAGFRMTGDRMDTPHCDGITFTMAGRDFKAPSVIVFDVMKLLGGDDLPKIDGAIGLDIFAGRAVTIEPNAHRLIVESPMSLRARIAGATEVPVRLVRDTEGVALSVDVGVPTRSGLAWMELDTGNGGTLVIANYIAALLGLDANRKEAQPAKFPLANGISVEGNARVKEGMIMDGDIGNQFLKHWNLTLDLEHSRAWLAIAPPGAPAKPH